MTNIETLLRLIAKWRHEECMNGIIQRTPEEEDEARVLGKCADELEQALQSLLQAQGAIWPAWHKLSEQLPTCDGIHDAVSSRKLCVVVDGDGRDEMCGLQVRSWNTAQGGSDRFDMGYSGQDENHNARVTDWCDLPEMPWYPPRKYAPPLAESVGDVEAALEAADKLSFAAQISGGVAGRDDNLVAAIDAYAKAREQQRKA